MTALASAAASAAPPNTIEPMLTTHDVAAALRVTPATVRRIIRDKEIISIRVGPHIRVRPSDLRAYILKAAGVEA